MRYLKISLAVLIVAAAAWFSYRLLGKEAVPDSRFVITTLNEINNEEGFWLLEDEVIDTSWFEFQGVRVKSATKTEELEFQLLEYDKENQLITPHGVEMIIPSKNISNNKAVLDYAELKKIQNGGGTLRIGIVADLHSVKSGNYRFAFEFLEGDFKVPKKTQILDETKNTMYR